MPAPPPDLTAASGAFVMDGRSSRRALTTAMLDLASRGLLTFREDKGLLGMSHKVGVDTIPDTGDPVEEAQRARNARKPIGPAEDYALRHLRALGDGKEGFIESDKLPEFGASVSGFDSALEDHVVKGGWVVEKPSRVVARWVAKGLLAIVAGGAAILLGANLPASGLVVIGGAAIAGGVVIMLFARSMPRVTMPGAMVRAMLAAYRRTLQKTMEQSRSMQQVVDNAGLAWLETPDQAVVWGTALGLQADIEGVLQRSLEDVREQPQLASATYFPAWYRTSDGSSVAGGLAAGSGGSIFSGSAVPDLGGMMSALGTIGNSPASSGSGGGGVRGRQFGRWRWRRRRWVLGVRLRSRTCRDRRRAADLDGWPRARSPALDGHPEPLRLSSHASRRQRTATVLLVPETARHGVRPRVIEECRGLGVVRLETIKGEGQHRRSHLLAETVALVRASEPGAGVDRAMDQNPWPQTLCEPMGRPSYSTIRLSRQSVVDQEPRAAQ